jgi:hypothetical protein
MLQFRQLASSVWIRTQDKTMSRELVLHIKSHVGVGPVFLVFPRSQKGLEIVGQKRVGSGGGQAGTGAFACRGFFRGPLD